MTPANLFRNRLPHPDAIREHRLLISFPGSEIEDFHSICIRKTPILVSHLQMVAGTTMRPVIVAAISRQLACRHRSATAGVGARSAIYLRILPSKHLPPQTGAAPKHITHGTAVLGGLC